MHVRNKDSLHLTFNHEKIAIKMITISSIVTSAGKLKSQWIKHEFKIQKVMRRDMIMKSRCENDISNTIVIYESFRNFDVLRVVFINPYQKIIMFAQNSCR